MLGPSDSPAARVGLLAFALRLAALVSLGPVVSCGRFDHSAPPRDRLRLRALRRFTEFCLAGRDFAGRSAAGEIARARF